MSKASATLAKGRSLLSKMFIKGRRSLALRDAIGWVRFLEELVADLTVVHIRQKVIVVVEEV